MAEVSLVKLSSDECHWASLMISQHWFRCLTAPSHYLSQCWLRPLPPYGVTRPQWLKRALSFDLHTQLYTCHYITSWTSKCTAFHSTKYFWKVVSTYLLSISLNDDRMLNHHIAFPIPGRSGEENKGLFIKIGESGLWFLFIYFNHSRMKLIINVPCY